MMLRQLEAPDLGWSVKKPPSAGGRSGSVSMLKIHFVLLYVFYACLLHLGRTPIWDPVGRSFERVLSLYPSSEPTQTIDPGDGRVITVAGTSMIRPYGLPGLDLGRFYSNNITK